MPELNEYFVDAWVPFDWQQTNPKSFTSGSKEEANNFIANLPPEYEYKIYKRVFADKF
jgi:hypothetical protein